MPKEKKEIILYGIPGSPGISHGAVFRFLHGDIEVPHYQVSESEQPSELSRFQDAVEMTRDQIAEIRNAVSKNLGEKEAGIFDAHLLVLEDKALFDDVEKDIKQTGDNIEKCVYRVTQRYHDYFNQLEDEYLRERASDLKDISKRLLGNLVGVTASGTAFLGEPRILVSEDLSPSDTASLDRSKILGIATDSGGRTSHAVIMARASGVPAVVGLRGLTEKLSEGDSILIDGFEGLAIINPGQTTLFRYGKVGLRRKRIKDLLNEEASLPTVTKDGTKINFLANADSPEEVISGIENGCEGVGLFRTESIFLRKNQIPSEDQQFEDYSEIVSAAGGQVITIRTLDLGGDKILDSIGREKEENPFMGFRAIRYCLRNPAIFLDQLRAILRVSAFGKVKIMFPMISGVGELVRAKEFLFTAKRQLTDRGIEFDEEIEVGCMIETPSAVTICDMLADEVDFFSVGTNDLVQYLLAVDRVNNQIAYLYEPHHPAVIRALLHIFQVSKQKNVEVTLCGEIAGDPHFLPLLIGLGLDSFSATGTLIPELKFFGRRFTTEEAQELKDRITKMRRSSEVKACLKAFYDDRVSELMN
ncbi:MAG: phosphoenolpyruvate--protein phosphotransferase [Opitutae bacterium]|jgi:phosphoenolpyruvate-protein phosphotransferase (PTS system enzyme I)|nr:phosphoenolpyruvate--protein phosphotransferase [Opitutae bacterium]